MSVVMECGHAVRAGGACPICAPTPAAATEAEQPDLVGRVAECDCGTKAPSSTELPFFEYRGSGSRAAVDLCGECGYARVAHDPAGAAVVEKGKCDDFVAHGPWEDDSWYCGHDGWS